MTMHSKDALSATLVAVGVALLPEAAKERLGKHPQLRKEVRTWQAGLCWSFAEGVRRWIGDDAKLAAVWIEDPEYEQYPIHVLCRAPSGLLLDSHGIYRNDKHAARKQEKQWMGSEREPDDDTLSPTVEATGGFVLRQKGIFPPRERLVKLIANTLEEAAGPASGYRFLWPR
jgi:hypothetical protein